jgi:spore coat protein CotH
MSLRFRRHYRLLILLVLVLGTCVLALGDARIIAYTVAGRGRVGTAGADHGGPVDLFDSTVVHSIEIAIDEADYQQMLTTYRETGQKDYFRADVVIDGALVHDVGLRLKGNASLRTALGGRLAGGMGAGPGGLPAFDPGEPPGRQPGQPPGEEEGRAPEPASGDEWQPRQPPAGAVAEGQSGAGEGPPAGAAPEGQAGPGRQPRAGGMPGGNWGAEAGEGQAATKIPFLIKFDQFVPGQTYQGLDRLAIRTYGASYDAAMLQEPVTNAILGAAGLPVTRTAYAGVRLNGGDEELFSLSEVIGEDYLARYFANPNGVLYKAELGADLAYQGEDPSAYATHFTQQTRVNDADLAPLIDLARFVSESDEEAFETGLAARLDVGALATYLAANNLLVNVDSMGGMSNNYYLYYDDMAERFTVLMWDANESLGKLGGGNQSAAYDLYYTGAQGMAGGRGGIAGPDGLGGPGRTNTLVTRFLAVPAFRTLYEAKLLDIYAQAYDGGALDRQIEEYAALVRAAAAERSSLVDLQSYEQAVASVQAFVAQRAAYLAGTELVAGQAGAPGGLGPSPRADEDLHSQ